MRTEPTWEHNRLAARWLRQSLGLRSSHRFGTALRDRLLRKWGQCRRWDRNPSTGHNRRGLVQTKRVGSTKDYHTSGPSNPTLASNSLAPSMPMSSSAVKRTSEPNIRTMVPNSLVLNNSVPRSSIGTSAGVGNRRLPRNPTNSNSPRPSARPLALQTFSSYGPPSKS